ncbi:Os05g0132800, partial [Oryza sativa Japonica Group]
LSKTTDPPISAPSDDCDRWRRQLLVLQAVGGGACSVSILFLVLEPTLCCFLVQRWVGGLAAHELFLLGLLVAWLLMNCFFLVWLVAVASG